MDIFQKDLYAQAIKGTLERNCHGAVLDWLFSSKIINKGEHEIGLRLSSQDFKEVLVHEEDPEINHKDELRNLPGGMVLGFYNMNHEIEHSIVTLGGGMLAGANNLGATGGACKTDAYTQVSMDDLMWGGSNAYLTKYGLYSKGKLVKIHYQHPVVIGNRFARYLAAH